MDYRNTAGEQLDTSEWNPAFLTGTAESRQREICAASDLVDLCIDLSAQQQFAGIVGKSRAIREVFVNIRKVAAVETRVLLSGETGTGKELVAQALHHLSPRSDRPFIRVNCGALPADLIESELFGHERGAFTGATQRKTGRFEWADGGTLFLDEIGELPLPLQAKLLRVLEKGEFERLGGDKTIRGDVRIVAATNRELRKEVDGGTFRRDLYYRLNVFPITLPALRKRKEDIPLLTAHFVQYFNKKLKKDIRWITDRSMHALYHHTWPGNVRELENIMERAVVLSDDRVLQVQLPPPTAVPRPFPLKTMEEVERDHILRVLRATDGVVQGPDGAAEILAMHPSTLRSRMRKLDIRKINVFEK